MALPSSPSDEDLAEQLYQGDREALELLYQRYHHRLFNFILRMTGDRAIAEELLQETFLRLAESRRRYRRTASFRTYLYTIARNLCLDTLKSARWREHSLPGVGEARAAPPDRQPAARDVDPHAALEAREQAEAVRLALLQLPPADREVLILSRYEGLRYEEIAKLLGTTTGAVKARAHRALEALRRRLESFRKE